MRSGAQVDEAGPGPAVPRSTSRDRRGRAIGGSWLVAGGRGPGGGGAARRCGGGVSGAEEVVDRPDDVGGGDPGGLHEFGGGPGAGQAADREMDDLGRVTRVV